MVAIGSAISFLSFIVQHNIFPCKDTHFYSNCKTIIPFFLFGSIIQEENLLYSIKLSEIRKRHEDTFVGLRRYLQQPTKVSSLKWAQPNLSIRKPHRTMSQTGERVAVGRLAIVSWLQILYSLFRQSCGF